MTTALDVTQLRTLTDAELSDAYAAGQLDYAALEAECTRRDRRDRARVAGRARHAEWEAAAYAQYLTADAYCRGNMLSAAGKRRGRDAWPLCWQGSDETARRLASDELITFWDYVAPRVPGPGSYAAARRAAAAEYDSRAPGPVKPPSVRRAAPVLARPAPVLAPLAARPAPVLVTAPGSIARYTAALAAFGDHVETLTARILAERALLARGR